MKKSRGSGRLWLVTSILSVGVMSLFLCLDQASAERGDDRSPTTHVTKTDDLTNLTSTTTEEIATKPQASFGNRNLALDPIGAPNAVVANLLHKAEAHKLIKAGSISAANLKIFPTIKTNYLDDEATRMRQRGELVGRMMPRGLRAGVAAGGGCSFNVDCDDCDPCTNDRCVIDVAAGQGPGDGKCTNTVFEDGQQGGCSDGDPCNGIETCQIGICELPGSGTATFGRPYCAVGGGLDPNGICIGGVKNGEECDFLNAEATCPSPGSCEVAACDTDAPGVSDEDDFCVLPCTVAVCKRICSNEGTSVNAGDICVRDGDCPGGSCLIDNPCPGGNGDCDEAQGQTCLVDDAVCIQRDGDRICSGVKTCDVGAGTCSSDGVNPCGPGARCSERSCPGNFVCFSDADCSDGIVTLPCLLRASGPGCSTGRCCTTADGGLTFDCVPKKFGGIAACTGVWFPGDVGFTDESTCSGSKGCPKYGRGIAPARDQLVNIGFVSDSPCTGLFDLGDDYTFANGSFMKVDRIRFIGQVFGRASVEFFDADGKFIEDTISGGDFTGQFGVQSLEFDPPIVIPPSGFVVIRNAANFTPNGGLAWASAVVGATDPGGNDPDKMWVNGGVVSGWLEICDNGDNIGDWCNPLEAGADCPGGTCTASPNVLSFELVGTKTTAPIGACCNPDTVDCEEVLPWLCDAGNNIFNGAGTQCAKCDAGSQLLGSPCRICSAESSNVNEPCFADVDCIGGTCDESNSACLTCEGGDKDGLSCLTNDCSLGGGACGSSGTCELLPTCVTGACCIAAICDEDSSNAGDPCPIGNECLGGGSCVGTCYEDDPGTCLGGGTFSGFGSSCDPNCCTQPGITGGDDCGDTIVQNITVPGQADPPFVVTISGNNSGATASDDCSLGVFKTANNLPENVDLGWWEGFSINDCSFVTIDMCCSDPIHEPQWSFIVEGCPCTPSTTRGSSINPNKPDLKENARGAPFCDEDNLWMQFGPLPAGTYYIPILTRLAGAIGDYQLHITSEACPDAVCCHLVCDGGENNGDQCEVNSDCDSNSCIPKCDLLNVLECQEANGTFLAPPNRPVAVITCAAGICDTGSCCVGPGDCVDDVFAVPLTKIDCDGEGGKFAGGIRCFGGTCVADPDLSCATAADCADNGGPGGACTGSTEVLRQPSPCPICELISTNRCQFDDGVGAGAWISDNCVADCVASATLADDFKALEQGDITQVCTYGTYIDQNNFPRGCVTPPEPNFIVRIYEDGGGIPGLKIGDTTTTAVGGVDFIDSDGDPWYRFTLTLDNPIGTILINEIYWLEIQANTDPVAFGGDLRCDWFWGTAAVGQGNNYSIGVFGGRAEGLPSFTFANQRDVEQSWCINLANEPPTAPTRACCTCDPDNPCVETTFENCDILSGDFIVDQASCDGFGCPTTQIPVNDNCGDAIVVTDGTEPFSNFCSTAFGTQAMDQVVCAGGANTDFKADIWYEYTATCTGEASFELCDSGFFDSVLAVYGDETTTCTCPLSATTQIGECSDDGCIWGGGRSQLQVSVIEGNCYLIRVGGFGDAQDTGEIDISCGLLPTAPDAVNPHPYSTGALACGGGDSYGLPCQTCTGGSRAGLTCLSGSDCPGSGSCDPDDDLCLGTTTCGSTIAGGSVTFPWPGSRFVGFSSNTTWAGKQIAVRAKMVDIDGFPGCNGESLWAGEPAQFCEGGACDVMFWASELQDTPLFRDWTKVGDVQLYGQQVVPGSRYAIQALAIGDIGNQSDESKYSDPALLVDTATWGDVVPPLAGFTTAAQPSISDVLQLVDKWLGNLEPRKSRTLLQPEALNVNSSVGIADVLRGVDAWLGTPYPFSVTCP